MKITVCDKLKIENPTPAVIKYCKDMLTLDNPDYYKKAAMGKYTGNVPREICLYENIGNDLWLPFGCIQDIWRLCAGKAVPWDIQIRPIEPIKYDSSINLYPYQENAVNKAIKAKNGVLVMPCGSGKTQCGLEIISRVGGRALWLTHTQDLLNQSKTRAESVLGQGGFGTITAGKINIGTHITFATVQTMAKIDLLQYHDYWDIIIVDEAQHCAGSPTKVTQFYKVMSNLCARYKIGLTATPKRADKLEGAMFALLGPKIHEVTREEVAHTTCPVKVEKINTGWMPVYDEVLMGDGTIDYAKVIDAMIHDEERYKLVLAKVAQLDGATIVLANRVEYLQQMYDSLWHFGKKCICISGQGQSKKAKAERKKALEALNNGELDCVFASYQLAAEGLDCPNLRYIVFATPEKNEVTITQAAGRVGRKADGKPYGTVIDFVDNFGMYKRFYKERLKVYNKLNCDIIE